MRSVRTELMFLLIGVTVLAAGFTAVRSPPIPCCEVNQQPTSSASQDQRPHPTPTLELPITFERRTGDLDGMVKKREIRALVVPSRSGFFYDKGHPRGIYFEALDEFQRFVNKRFRTGTLKINVTYLPVRPEQLENALTEGVGDVIAYGVQITPEREKKVLFTTPIDSNVKQVIVTGPNAPPIASLEDLSGKEIYVNPLTVYYENLQDLSESLQKAGKPPISVKKADPNLTDEDLLEMVNAGLIPATVTINIRAEFWSKVFPHLTLHPNVVLKEDGQLAWVTRQDSPQLKQLLDEFAKGHSLGTSFGNTLLRRYLKNTAFVELVVAKEVGQETLQYVNNIYKYYVAYKLTLEESAKKGADGH